MIATRGRWQCLAEPRKCVASATKTTFDGPTQEDARREEEPLQCPKCGGKVIMYAGDQLDERPSDDIEEEHDGA